MINLEKAIEEFIKYTNTFDTKNEHIQRKIDHSIRVMNITSKISENLELSEEEKQVAILIGLLHDIGRFTQMKEFDTFCDSISVDHGDLSAEILKKDNYLRQYITTEKYDEIILTAIKNHNKYEISKEVNKEILIFCEIIRDADKIDILYECTGIFWNEPKIIKQIENGTIPDEFNNVFREKKVYKRNFNTVKMDKTIQVCEKIAFIFDINISESFKILQKENYINKMLDRFHFKDEDTYNKIEKFRKIANNYIFKKTCN